MRCRKQLRNLVAAITLVAATGNGMGQVQTVSKRDSEAPVKHSRAKTETCSEVAAWMNVVLRARAANGTEELSLAAVPREIALGGLRARDLDCAAVPSLAADVHFELTKVFFDRTLHSWEFLLRCANPRDCVPFLVRWPQTAGDPLPRDSAALVKASPAAINSQASQHFLLREGATVTLLWDQDGIRVVLPAICLEKGNIGDSIRVRIKSGTRVLRAEIVNESLLRAIL